MKINYIVSVALLACVASTAVNAQTATSARVDSVHPPLLRGAKPAKPGSATALNTNTAAAKSSSGMTAKPTRVVQVPAIATQLAAGSASVARVAAATDSGIKTAPPVARSAKVAKVKPPGE